MESLKNKILDEINNCRMKPYTYASKIREYSQYFKGNILRIPEANPVITSEGKRAFDEAATFLDHADPLEAFKYSPGLTHTAEDIINEIRDVEEMERLGDVDVDNYLKQYGDIEGIWAQAIDFGSETAELVVMNLIVDDGCPERINRQNIFGKNFKYIGVAVGTHLVYGSGNIVLLAEWFKERSKDRSKENEFSKKIEKIIEKREKDANEARKVNVVRRSSLEDTKNFIDLAKDRFDNKFAKIKIDDDMDLDMPEGCKKIERNERVVEEGGVKKKVVKITKYFEDGSVETEIQKEKL